MDSGVREKTPFAMIVINPRKEYWPSQRFKPATFCSQVSYASDWAMGLSLCICRGQNKHNQRNWNFVSIRVENLCKKEKMLVINVFNSFPNKPWFLRVCRTSLLKTLWEKEKLLVTSNFSFSHSVFYLFGEVSAIFTKFEIVCKLFEFGRV